MLIRRITTTLVGAATVLALSACTPPMPPELKAALAEQSYTCVEGETVATLPEEIVDLAEGFAMSVESACPGMTLQFDPSAKSIDLEVGISPSKICTPFATVPFAIDAGVIAFNIPNASAINLDAEIFSSIISKQITAWNDPAIVALNPDFSMPDLPIKVVAGPSEQANQAVANWIGRSVDVQEFALPTSSEFDLADLESGALTVLPYSLATYNYISFATMVIGQDVYSDVAVADMGGIWAASSQFQMLIKDSEINLQFDPQKSAVAPDGFDVAPNPYQAVYPISLHLCGDDSLKTRAMAKFLLRQDQQGSLAASAMLNVPEFMRVESLAIVSRGLPEPELPQELLDEIAGQ